MRTDERQNHLRRCGSVRWFVAGIIFLIYTLASADRANLGFALPFMRNEFSISNTEAGALLSMFFFAYALAQIPSGFAVSRFGVRGIFASAMILTSAFTALMGCASSLLTLKVYRFGLGLSEGPLPIGITTTINNWFPPQEKGTASGIFLAAAKFGPAIVPPLCAVIVATWGWREIFYLFAAPGVVLALVWIFFVPNQPSRSLFCSSQELAYIRACKPTGTTALAGQAPSRSWGAVDRLLRARRLPALTEAGQVFRSWNIWGCTLGYGFQVGISNVLLAWIPTYLLTVKNFSLMGAGFVAAAPWVGAVAGNVLGGWLSDRVLGRRRKPGMMFSAMATAVMMYLLINSPADATTFGLLLFLTGALLSIGFSTYMSYPMSIAAPGCFPIASSLVNTGGQLGGAAAPLLVGMLLDIHGWDAVFALMAIGSLLSLVAVSTIVEPIEE